MTNQLKGYALLICCIFLCGRLVLAQTPSPSPSLAPPPANDIFLIEITHQTGKLTFGKPIRISTWDGYNNQPFFLPDGKALLYTSIRADKQADIYRYEIKTAATTRVTETPESEYSATVTLDGKFFSVIRVEADSTQRLWKFPLAGGKPALVLEKIKPVGYQCWIDDHTLALFILGQAGPGRATTPNTLQLVDVRTEKADVIAENIGRVIRRIPRQNKISFVAKISAKELVIRTFDLQTRQITTLIKTLPDSEDYAWTPAGVLLMAKDSKLFAWNPARDKDWEFVADFKTAGLTSITRIAVSPKGDRIAIVARHTP